MTAPVFDLGSRQPFKQYALEYLARGWTPLPLPAGEKSPPPNKVTGRFPAPSEDDVNGWLSSEDDRANIGIRVPDGIIGVDVDAYSGKKGGATLGTLTERWGPLPDTWTLTARADGISGIRFFRVPLGLKLPGQLGADIEIVQHHHRYAVTFPSKHPKLHKSYRWYEPGNRTDGKNFSSEIPDADSDAIPDFPQAWLDGIDAREYVEKSRAGIQDTTEAWTWVKALPGAKDDPCKLMAEALRSTLEGLLESSGGSAHEQIYTRTMYILKLGAEGHKGAWHAVRDLRKAFVQEVAERRQSALLAGQPAGTVRTSDEARREFQREFIGAVDLLMVDPVSMGCSCWDEPIIGRDTDTGEPIYAESGRATDPAGYPPGDIGNAEHLVDLADGNLLWNLDEDVWLGYNPTTGVWRGDGADAGLKLARSIAPRVRAALEQKTLALRTADDSNDEAGGFTDAAILKNQIKALSRAYERISSGAGLRDAVAVAKTYDEMVAGGSTFDADPDILHCTGGDVLELGKGGVSVRKAIREDRLTRHTATPYVPGAEDPLWNGPEGYLETFLPDLELRRYIFRLLGYALLGSNPSRKLVFLLGPTSTGKSTLVEAVKAALGNYAGTFNMSLLREAKEASGRPDVLRTLRLRAIFASEGGKAHALHNDQIKRIFGGDSLSERLHHGNSYFEGVPAATPFISANSFPHITHADPALWRRLIVVPFETEMPQFREDTEAGNNLRTSPSAMAAVFASVVAGYVDFRATGSSGLDAMPECVKTATFSVRKEASADHAWFYECLKVTEDSKRDFAAVADIHVSYKMFCDANEIDPRRRLSAREVAQFLDTMGVSGAKNRKVDNHTMRVRQGVRLLQGDSGAK